jgi:hypothetical protein
MVQFATTRDASWFLAAFGVSTAQLSQMVKGDFSENVTCDNDDDKFGFTQLSVEEVNIVWSNLALLVLYRRGFWNVYKKRSQIFAQFAKRMFQIYARYRRSHKNHAPTDGNNFEVRYKRQKSAVCNRFFEANTQLRYIHDPT